MSTALHRLRGGEVLAGAGSAALLVVLVALPWYGDRPPRTGWQAVPVLRWLILVTIACGLALTGSQALSRSPALPVSLDVIGSILGGATTLLLAIRLRTTSAPPRAGGFLGLAASAALTLGAFKAMREEEGWTPGPDRPIELATLPSRQVR